MGGRLRVRLDDFAVEEIPAYAPSGNGPHVLATVEKRGLTTFEAVRRLAAALGVAETDCGTAGLKDKAALAVQQVSLPPPVTPQAALAVSIDGLRVLAAERHGNKLKTGHLRGNRFVLIVRELAISAGEAAERAGAILRQLARPPGVPAWYGEQRFGEGGRNVELGRRLLRGERVPGGPRERRLLINAVQSELFNRWLAARLADGLYHRVLAGDLLRRTDSGGLFTTVDVDADQLRLERGEIAPTGPMFGPSMRSPAAGSPAAERESAVLAGADLDLEDFARAGRLAEGTRRPVGFPLVEAAAFALPDGALELRFVLPPGAYATVVAAEVMKENG